MTPTVVFATSSDIEASVVIALLDSQGIASPHAKSVVITTTSCRSKTIVSGS